MNVIQLSGTPAVARNYTDVRPGSIIILARHDVDDGLREIFKSASMVKIEVRYHDVPHVR